MKGLNQLRQTLFKETPSDQDKIFRICEIINYCGGYLSFLETPLPIIFEISKYFDEANKHQEKVMGKFPKIKHGS
jgi:hypothetical protein